MAATKTRVVKTDVNVERPPYSAQHYVNVAETAWNSLRDSFVPYIIQK